MTRSREHAKIKDLDELKGILDAARAAGRTIVHCHGVFDLLHIGHIRHLREARGFGDVLVVTVTPDRFVNKGPGRPAFTETLRAEALAALEFVDYVAINRWPTAVEVIQLVRPHTYVKGPDYKSPEKDVTGAINHEEDAVRAVGGKLHVTDDITFSSSALINRHLQTLPRDVQLFMGGFAARHSIDEVQGYVRRARDLKVLVVGEAIIDEYQYCEAIGKSSKEPMLAVKHLATERFAGGTLAVANNVAGFAKEVGLLTVLGVKNSHEDFILENMRSDVRTRFLYRETSPTIVKRRFVEQYFFTKLMEIYEFNDGNPSEAENVDLCRALEEEIPKYDLVIVVDYGHGMLTREAIDIICKHSAFLVVNAQSNAGNLGYHAISKYPRADFVSLAEKEIRLEARDRYGDLQPTVLDVARRIGAEQMAVTRGKAGCLCYSVSKGFSEVPALATQVVDRMGAGDAFLSVASLVAAQRAPMEILGFLGNAAGAEAVRTVGHRTNLESVPLLKHVEHLMK